MSLMNPTSPSESQTRERLDNYTGRIVVMTPLKMEHQVQTQYGAKDACSILLSAYNGEGKGFTHVEGIRVFNKWMVEDLRKARAANSHLVGRLVRVGRQLSLAELPAEELEAVAKAWAEADAFEGEDEDGF